MGCCNWPAVFSINRHYGPLCWPVPLAALLFLEAPGSSRASALARFLASHRLSLLFYSQHHSPISRESLSSLEKKRKKHAVDYEKLDETEGLTKACYSTVFGDCVDWLVERMIYPQCYVPFVFLSAPVYSGTSACTLHAPYSWIVKC